jgi:hypothetical protein
MRLTTLKMAYPKTTPKRAEELKAIGRQLAGEAPGESGKG